MLLAVLSAGYTCSNNNERTQLHDKNIGNCIKIAKSEKKARYTFSNTTKRNDLHTKNIGNCILIAKGKKEQLRTVLIILKGMNMMIRTYINVV